MQRRARRRRNELESKLNSVCVFVYTPSIKKQRWQREQAHRLTGLCPTCYGHAGFRSQPAPATLPPPRHGAVNQEEKFLGSACSHSAVQQSTRLSNQKLQSFTICLEPNYKCRKIMCFTIAPVNAVNDLNACICSLQNSACICDFFSSSH